MPKKDLQHQGHLFLQSAYAHSPPSAATFALLALVTVLGSALFASVECKQGTEVARTIGLGSYLFSCYLPSTCELGVTQQRLGEAPGCCVLYLDTQAGFPVWPGPPVLPMRRGSVHVALWVWVPAWVEGRGKKRKEATFLGFARRCPPWTAVCTRQEQCHTGWLPQLCALPGLGLALIPRIHSRCQVEAKAVERMEVDG